MVKWKFRILYTSGLKSFPQGGRKGFLVCAYIQILKLHETTMLDYVFLIQAPGLDWSMNLCFIRSITGLTWYISLQGYNTYTLPESLLMLPMLPSVDSLLACLDIRFESPTISVLTSSLLWTLLLFLPPSETNKSMDIKHMLLHKLLSKTRWSFILICMST